MIGYNIVMWIKADTPKYATITLHSFKIQAILGQNSVYYCASYHHRARSDNVSGRYGSRP